MSMMETAVPTDKKIFSKRLRLPAKIISYLFHPTFMPTIMSVVIIYLCRNQFAAVDRAARVQWVGNIALNTIFFPIVLVLLLKALNFISSIQLHDRKERIIPLIGTMVFYFWAAHTISEIAAPLVLRVLMLGAFWGIILLFLVNIFTKISMHTTAAGGAIGVLIVLMMISSINVSLPFLLVLFFAGVVGTARLVLQAHRPVELWLGYGVGLIVQLAAYMYLK